MNTIDFRINKKKEKTMKICMLDIATLGKNIDFDQFDQLGEVVKYDLTLPDETIEHIADADCVVTNKVIIGEKIFKASPNLKLICLTATGMNNIDLDAAEKYGVTVKNVKGYSTASVTQHTFSMLLHLMEHNRFYEQYTRNGGWTGSHTFTNISRPFGEIKGKNWGIIGLGDIGREVAKIATVFGANVSYFSASGNRYDDDYKYFDNLHEFMRSNTIITVHTPMNAFTHNLIAKAELELLQPGSFLINVARGGIINEEDVAWAVDNLDIYHGTDVLEVEPMQENHPFLGVKRQERLFMTPHIAWASNEARSELMKKVAENIRDFVHK